MRRTNILARVAEAVSLPWNAFVAAFLYYTLLAALALGGASVRGPVVAGAYSMPLAVWAATVAVRLARSAAARVADIAVSPRLVTR